MKAGQVREGNYDRKAEVVSEWVKSFGFKGWRAYKTDLIPGGYICDKETGKPLKASKGVQKKLGVSQKKGEQLKQKNGELQQITQFEEADSFEDDSFELNDATVLADDINETDYEDLDVIPCGFCGKEIHWRAKLGRPRRFCSHDCLVKYYVKYPKKTTWKSYERVKCAACGKEFYDKKWFHRKYCSIQCCGWGKSHGL